MSLAEQARRMRQHWPGFRLVANWGFIAQWEGEVCPLAQTYRLRIVYVLRNTIAGQELHGFRPATWLIEPTLRVCSPYAPGQRVPHVYPDEPEHLERSRLCFFDPGTKEWHCDLAIADTIVPWAIDWLTSYEGWLATGEWTGGGRKH